MQNGTAGELITWKILEDPMRVEELTYPVGGVTWA